MSYLAVMTQGAGRQYPMRPDVAKGIHDDKTQRARCVATHPRNAREFPSPRAARDFYRKHFAFSPFALLEVVDVTTEIDAFAHKFPRV